jgi:RNA polymerase-binding transcription factor DksA
MNSMVESRKGLPSEAPFASIEGLLCDELAAQKARAAEQRRVIADVVSNGRPDRNELVEQATAEELLRHAEVAIADIEHALRRVREGTYGRCEMCGRGIPFERLEALPEARTCVSC